MGSKGGLVAPPPLPPSVECCMCGDHGLPVHIFRCHSCNFRYQHKYCSELYPKAESYKTCNWCMREEGKAKNNNNNNNGSPMSSSPAISDNINNTSNNSIGSTTNTLKLQRSLFTSQLDKPVKKQRLRPLQRSASEVIVRSKPEIVSSPTRRGRQGFRAKIRRYKLLEEVST